MLIKPTNILSIDHLQPITIENQEYKSISHFIYSKLICGKNKRIIQNARADSLKKEFKNAFLDCYKEFLWSNIKRAIDIKFSIPYFLNLLLDTGKGKLFYMTYNKSTEFGVNDQFQGQNKIGNYIMQLRDKLVDKTVLKHKEIFEQRFIDEIFIVHTEYELLLKYIRRTGKKVTEKNVNSSLLVEYNELLSQHNLTQMLSSYNGELKNFIQDKIHPLLLSEYSKDYRKSVAETYKRGYLSDAEMNQLTLEDRTELYFDLLNFDAQDKKTKIEYENEKLTLLTEYLYDFFTRKYPNSDKDVMTQQFLSTTEKHKLQSLADRLFNQIENKELPEYLFDILNLKKQQIITLKKKVTFSVKDVKQHPVDLEFTVEKNDSIVIRETFNPTDPLNSQFSLTYTHPYIFNNLGYPTLLHYVLSRTACMESFDIEKDIAEVRKSMLFTPSVSNLSTNIRDFRDFDACGDIAYKYAVKHKNIRLFKYVQQAIYEKTIRDPEYTFALKNTQGPLYYFDPANLFLGVDNQQRGKNMVGNLLVKIRKELNVKKYVPLNIPVLFLLNDSTVKSFIFNKIDKIVEIIAIFGEYINLPRHGFVDPLNAITESSIKYVMKRITGKCLFTNTTYAIPNMITEKINQAMKTQTNYTFSKYLPIYVWNYIYQLLIVYYFYIYKTMDASKKQEILNDIDSFGMDKRLRNINLLVDTLNNIKVFLNDYVKDSQQESEYALKILLGPNEYDKFVSKQYNVNDNTQILNFIQNNDILWKRIFYFNSI